MNESKILSQLHNADGCIRVQSYGGRKPLIALWLHQHRKLSNIWLYEYIYTVYNEQEVKEKSNAGECGRMGRVRGTVDKKEGIRMKDGQEKSRESVGRD